MNSLDDGNRGRKRKESEEGGINSQAKVLIDPIQVKKKRGLKISTKKKRNQYWRRTRGKKNGPCLETRYATKLIIALHFAHNMFVVIMFKTTLDCFVCKKLIIALRFTLYALPISLHPSPSFLSL